MSAKTVEQLITDSLRDIGIAAAGEPVDPEDMTLGQTRLNNVIDDYKTDRGLIYQVIRELYAVTPSTASYTIGPGADWNVTTQPVGIVRAGFVNTAVNPAQPLETEIHVYTDEEWADIGLKTLTSTVIWGMWYETSFKQTAPIGSGRVFVYPIVTVNAQVALYLPVAIDEIAEDEAGLATTLYVPPGYRSMFKTSLSMDLCDAFEMDPKPSLVAKWNRAMKRVRRKNTKAMSLRLPKGLTRRGGSGGYNILTNQ